jgi:hypothetical protein
MRSLPSPMTVNDMYAAALLARLGELYNLLEERLPAPAAAGEPSPAAEPAPANSPDRAVPVQEPAPASPPGRDGDEDDETPVEVNEPAPPANPEPLPAPPPRAGRGSSEQAWRGYAELVGVTVPDGAGRDDIIAACEAAGVIEPKE